MPTPPDEAPTDSARLIAERYRLDREIGGGAMGTVWSGTDELLRRQVAVKEIQLPPGMPEREAAELRERALREARAIAVVSHPNVVTLYDVARQDGEPYVVMELVPSQSLATIIDEHGALEGSQLALIADGVAAALEAAHRSGIVHRDVKPGNVLLGDTGQVKLSDFGISRNIAESTLTRTGIMLGTPAFIAPEIASGDSVTAAADLWGLGATLFAAAEGRPPYDVDGDALATVTSVVHDPVPVPSITGPLAEVITGLMVKEPGRRMPLAEARHRLHRLLPAPGARPFDMLLDPEAPTLRVHRPTSTDQPAPEPETTPAPPSAPEPEPAPLASDPGPLPFTPREPSSRPRRRSRLAKAALGLATAALFLLASAGSFAAVRTLAEAPILPEGSAPAPRPGPQPVVRWLDDAAHTSDGGGNGKFAITVPPGLTAFHSERDDFVNGKSVHFLSEDGQRQIVVERFGGYFEKGYDLDDYLDELPDLATSNDGELAVRENSQRGEGAGTLRRLVYTSVDPGIAGSSAQGAMRRSTVAELIRRGEDLWIVRVTVPAPAAERGAEMFAEARPDFVPAR